MELKALCIQSGEFTPEIQFDLDGAFKISGVSRPEDVAGFYEKPIEWLKTFKEEMFEHAENKYKVSKIQVVFNMKYFNSASAKHILKMLDLWKSFQDFGVETDVDWFYEEADEQLLEDGQDLSEAVEIPFNFIQLTD